MSPADRYRKLAAELEAKARRHGNDTVRSEWYNLARGYLRLAEHAERNSLADLVYQPAWAFPHKNWRGVH